MRIGSYRSGVALLALIFVAWSAVAATTKATTTSAEAATERYFQSIRKDPR